MSNNPRRPVIPDWKELLCLGEELLDNQSSHSQSLFFKKIIKERIKANCEVFFSRPYYPLPGDPEIITLPSEAAPGLVSESFHQRKILMEIDGELKPISPEDNPTRVAYPITTAQNLLGILLIERSKGFLDTELDFIEKLCAHSALALQVIRQVVIKNWRFDQLAQVRSVSKQIQNQQDLDSVCKQITRLIQETFNIYYVSIFTLDSSTEMLRFRANAGKVKTDQGDLECSVQLGEGIIGTVAQTGQEMTVHDVQMEPLFRHTDALPETQSEVALPIKMGDQMLGVLDLQSNQHQMFHEYDLMILRALTDNIATAIEGARLFEGLEKKAGQVSAVLELSHALTSILDFEKLMEEVVHSIQKHFGYSFVHIFISNSYRRKLIYEAGSGARSKALQERQVTYDLDDPVGIIPFVARTGQTLLANDVSHEPLYRPSELPPTNTKAELAIPLVLADQVLGVLDLQSDQVDGFDIADIPLLEALSASIAIAIRNATLYRSETWRRKVADSFREIAGLVSANIALDELLDRILTELETTLPCEVSAIWLVNEHSPAESESVSLELAAVHGNSEDRVIEALGDSTARTFLEDGMESHGPIIRKSSDPIGPLGLSMGYSEDYSSIAVTLRAGEQILGVLALAHPCPDRYGNEAGLVAMTMASNAAVAIQNNILFASAQEQAWVSTVLLQISETIQVELTVEELLATMARITPLLIGVKKCAFFILDNQTHKFLLKSHYGYESIDISTHEFDQELPAFQQLTSFGGPVFIQDPQLELDLSQAALDGNGGTIVLLPLLSRSNLLGAYLVSHQVEGENQTSNTFDQQFLSLLQGIAQQTAVALENLQLLEARQEEAYVTAVLLQVAQAVVSQNELEDVLDTIVHLMPILVGIDACGIYLWNVQDQVFRTSEVFASSSKDADQEKGEIYTPGDFPLLKEVYEKDSMFACQLDTPDLPVHRWTELNCFAPAHDFNWQEMQVANWVLGVPLSLKGEVYGVMVALEQNVPTSFHERRLEILNGIAQQVSLAIQNEKLNQEMVQRERLEKEIQLARQIQRTFLPSRLPQVSGWEIDIHWQTAREVGGDFYDVFKIDKDRLGLVIADVSDKGMPAALYMTVARTLIRAFVRSISSPARILERVNKLLVVDSRDGLFVTAIYAVLNTKNGSITYANAGHNLPLIIRGESRKVEPLPKGGMALGILSMNKLEDHTIEMSPGDSILMYTDGVTECFSPSGQVFGEERLVNTLISASDNRVAVLKTHLTSTLASFCEGTSSSDDLTMVFLHRFSQGNSRE